MLPETNRQLALLVALCIVAPILNWAGSLVTRELPNPDDPRSVYRCDRSILDFFTLLYVVES